LGDGRGSASTTAVKSDPYQTISQPKARYTEVARKAEVQGAVRLRITLLANGNVGSVVAVTELPGGLTEKAIEAAKRIVFLPKRVNGVPVSVVITREYTFTIY
jgi:TonB family protein